ncbi:hypothetical protein KKB18_10525, partial [bacterium]|nr:hypothetical protein [bacterium]
MLKTKFIIPLIIFIALTSMTFCEQASVELSINQKNFSSDDNLSLSARMNPAGSTFDEYFIIEVPGGNKIFIDNEGKFHHSVPASRRVVENPVSFILADLTLSLIPDGLYRWWIVYIPVGSSFSENNTADWIFDTKTFSYSNSSKSRKEFIAVTNTDFQSLGTLSIIDPVSKAAVTNDVETLSSDPIVCVYKDKLYIVNRYQSDNIQVIDPAKGYKTTLQFSTGNGSNPQYIAFASESKVYISRYDTKFNDLLIVNPLTGAEIGTIDMTPYSDNDDKTPRPNQMLMLNDELFVLIQDLNASWDDFGISKVVVINTMTDEVTKSIPLVGKDPYSIKYLPETGLIYLSDRGLSWPYTLSGGIEVIDPFKKVTLGLLIDDDVLKGNCGEMEILSATKGYIIVSDENFSKSIVAFNPQSGEIYGSIYDSPGSVIESIELTDDGYLVIAERYESLLGVMFIDTADDKLIEGPISTGSLPPFAL